MKISIAMATYNGERFVAEQLDSFIKQTRQPDELIISDDGSSDSTLEIAEAFRKSAPFDIRILRSQTNLGYAGNFNRAICETTGDLVFLSDQDDVWFPQKIRRIESEAKKTDALLFINDAAFADKNLRELGQTKQEQFRRGGISLNNFVMGCCVGVKRELLDVCLPIPPEFPAHDAWLVRFADELRGKVVLSEVLQWYRRHGENESKVLVNREVRLTRRAVNVRRIEDLLKDITRGQWEGNSRWENNLRILCNAVKHAPQISEPYTENLESMKQRLERCVAICDYRTGVRRAPRYRRIPEILRLWRQRKYENCGGMQSLLRDLLARG